MYDLKLPENMWDLDVGAAVHAYNRTPHKSNDMKIPLRKFVPNKSFDMRQIKRFGCVGYAKVHRKIGPKFSYLGQRVVLVGYTPTGFLVLKPEIRKYSEARNIRFNEKIVYGDVYKRNEIKYWPEMSEGVNKENWFIEYEKILEKEEEVKRSEGRTKRKRGRPRKIREETKDLNKDVTEETKTDSNYMKESQLGKLNDVSFKDDMERGESEKRKDEIEHALLAQINQDPINYTEAMKCDDKEEWKIAVEEELSSMRENEVWILVDRSETAKLGRRANTLDSKWVFKKKIDVDGKEKNKARLVIRGFKDRNVYDLSKTYAPVSRLPLVRCVFSIINAYDLDVCQLDVTSAFLNGTIDENMYMEIPEGDDNRD